MDSERALTHLGKWSRWQVFMYIIIDLFVTWPSCWQMLNIVFIGLEPSHHCTLPEGLSNSSIPLDKNGGLSGCLVYENFSTNSNKTEKCPLGYTYGDEFDTIVNTWDLVCDAAYLVSTSQLCMVLGLVTGSLFVGYVSDKYGRKIVFLVSAVLLNAIGVITAFNTNFTVFLILRFLAGITEQGNLMAGFILSCELFPAEQRTLAGQLMQIFWALAMFIMALFAYLIANWRHFQLALSVAPLILVIPCFWVIPESIPWLVAKGRIKDAKKILQSAAKWNHVTLPEEYDVTAEEMNLIDNKPIVMNRTKEDDGNSEKESLKNNADNYEENTASVYSILDLFKSWKLVLYALGMCFMWFTSGLGYYGLSLNVATLAGNLYLNFFLSGLVEIPAYLVSAFTLHFIGRRYPILTFFAIFGLSLLLTTAFPNSQSILVTLSMFGKFGITGAWAAICLWAPEIFPTTLRNIGFGFALFGSHIGGLVAPYTSYISRSTVWLPNVLFGTFALISCLFCLFLPETLGRPLATTIEEIEKWSLTLSKEEKAEAKRRKNNNSE